MTKRKVTLHEVDLVQGLIEMCLQLYMRLPEIVDKLFQDEKIEPCVTETVLERLEKQNPEFFEIYYTRLTVKDQIIRFNQLLQQQVEMSKAIPDEIVTTHLANGSQILQQQVEMSKAIPNEIVTTRLASGSQIHSTNNYQDYQQMPEMPSTNMHYMTNDMPNFHANGELWQQDSTHHAVGMQGQQTMLVDTCANMPLTIGETSIPPYVGEISNTSTNDMPNFHANGELWQQDSMHHAVGMPMLVNTCANVPLTIGETSIPPYVGEISNTSTIEEFALEDPMYWQSTQMTPRFNLTDSTTDWNYTDVFANISFSPLPESVENIDESNVAADINGQEQGSNAVFGLEFIK